MTCGLQPPVPHRIIPLLPVHTSRPTDQRPHLPLLGVSEAMAKFNLMQGKLRISLTHACQLRCKFCHQEGIEAHWKPVHIRPEHLRSVLDSYSRLGGRYVELTGGEPLLHPRVAELVGIAHAAERHVTLCTNGLLLGRILAELRRGCIQLVKVSLHAPSNSDDARWLLGRAWDFDQVASGILRALDAGAKVQLLYTLTEVTMEGLPKVLDLALKWGVDVQLVDLIRSRGTDMRSELGYLGADLLEEHVRPRAKFETCAFDRTGATLKIYRTHSGATWEVKDSRYGLFHSAMCAECALKQDCGEGVYALRMDALGGFKPCLLREDLDVQPPSSDFGISDEDSTIGSLISLMTTELPPPMP